MYWFWVSHIAAVLCVHFPEKSIFYLTSAWAQMHFSCSRNGVWGLTSSRERLSEAQSLHTYSDEHAWSCHVQQGLGCQSRSDFVFRTCSLLRPRSLFLMISDQYFIFSKRVESFACLSLCQYSLSIANSSLADICSQKFLDIVKTQPWWALCPVQLWKLSPSLCHQQAPPTAQGQRLRRQVITSTEQAQRDVNPRPRSFRLKMIDRLRFSVT